MESYHEKLNIHIHKLDDKGHLSCNDSVSDFSEPPASPASNFSSDTNRKVKFRDGVQEKEDEGSSVDSPDFSNNPEGSSVDRSSGETTQRKKSREYMLLGGEEVHWERQIEYFKTFLRSEGQKKRAWPPGITIKEKCAFRNRSKRMYYDTSNGALYMNVKGLYLQYNYQISFAL